MPKIMPCLWIDDRIEEMVNFYIETFKDGEIHKVDHYPDGRIITITSILGHIVRPGDAIYPVAKQGLTGLMRAIAVEYGARGITSNAIAPGMFATETNAALAENPEMVAFAKLRVPLQRWGRPDEIAGAALFLASDAASFVNGHVLTVDGGISVRL